MMSAVAAAPGPIRSPTGSRMPSADDRNSLPGWCSTQSSGAAPATTGTSTRTPDAVSSSHNATSSGSDGSGRYPHTVRADRSAVARCAAFRRPASARSDVVRARRAGDQTSPQVGLACREDRIRSRRRSGRTGHEPTVTAGAPPPGGRDSPLMDDRLGGIHVVGVRQVVGGRPSRCRLRGSAEPEAGERLRSVTEQLDIVLRAAVTPSPVRTAISEAQGLLCAEEVVASAALPAFDQAAVDGYAVRFVDIAEASAVIPVELPVVGEVRAGSRSASQTAASPERLRHDRRAAADRRRHRRPPVRDRRPRRRKSSSTPRWRRVPTSARPGRTCSQATWRCAPARSSAPPRSACSLPSAGTRCWCTRRPRLSIISFGEELVDIARTPGPGQVYDVNSYALAAAARDAGADVNRIGIAPSDLRRLKDMVEARLLVSEMVIIAGAAGGALSGLVAEELSELGRIDLERVAMQPGSAQGFGLLGEDKVPTFLLPSNPVSALVVFEVIVRPTLRAMLGRRNPYRRTVTARTLEPIVSPPGRRSFLRGQLMRDDEDDYLVHVLGGGTTHLLASLAEANCLVLVDEDADVRQGRCRGRRVVPGAAGLTAVDAGRNWAEAWPVRLGPVRTRSATSRCDPCVVRRERWQRLRLQRRGPDPTVGSDRSRRLAAATFRRRLPRAPGRRCGRRLDADMAFPFAMTVRQRSFAGQVTVAGVQGFPVHSGWVGYWVGSEFTGHGVATLAVALGVGHALGAGGLHRVDATVAPENAPSRRVLEHLGFRQEGLLRRYLDVDGEPGVTTSCGRSPWRSFPAAPRELLTGPTRRWRRTAAEAHLPLPTVSIRARSGARRTRVSGRSLGRVWLA